jgi:pimeloyl-ACP methyl ester carboxylesterase
VPHLVGDVVALLDQAGVAAAHIVGHDWGGIVAWHLAGEHPARVLSLTVLSTPHPRAFRHSLLRSTQLLRSWYAVSWQLPVLPEAALTARGGAVMRRALVSSGLPADVADRYTAGMLRPGRLTAALNWYRAVGRRPRAGSGLGVITVPTTFVWSSGDVALGRRAADDTAHFVSGPYRYEVLEGEPHWLPEVRPGEVARLIIAQAKNP